MMQTIAHQIYPEYFWQLESIVSSIQSNDLPQAHQLLRQGLAHLDDIAEPSEQLQVELFLKALQVRLDDSASVSNLYLMPDQGRQIQMFNFMAEKFPVVRKAQEIANGLLLAAMSSEQPVTLIDIGIGTGQQAAQLLAKMQQQGRTLPHLTVIGIEPSEASLTQARTRLEDSAKQMGLPFTFIGLQKTAEQMTATDWDLLQSHAGQGALLLNASFALHHTRPVEGRTELFKRLKALNPAVFVLIEPYGDYVTEDLVARFRHAWHHYGLTFRAIDTIEASIEEKSEVKRIFFGRELPDVMAEADRVEQYETAEMWLKRLKDAGFAPQAIPLPKAEQFNSLIQIAPHQDYVGFTVNEHPIVAVIAAS